MHSGLTDISTKQYKIHIQHAIEITIRLMFSSITVKMKQIPLTKGKEALTELMIVTTS